MVAILIKIIDAVGEFDMTLALLSCQLFVVFFVLFDGAGCIRRHTMARLSGLRQPLHHILKYMRRLHVRFLAKPIFILRPDTNMLPDVLVRRLRLNVLFVESHISMRIRHSVLNCGLVIIKTLHLSICPDIILK